MIDFVFMTLFQHYKLYQFVLTQERADDITKCELDIEPPLVPEPLRDGVPKSVWDEEQRIKQIEEMEQKRIQVMYVQERARFFMVDWNRWINVACPNLKVV